jgi:C1A family cysteine protease
MKTVFTVLIVVTLILVIFMLIFTSCNSPTLEITTRNVRNSNNMSQTKNIRNNNYIIDQQNGLRYVANGDGTAQPTNQPSGNIIPKPDKKMSEENFGLTLEDETDWKNTITSLLLPSSDAERNQKVSDVLDMYLKRNPEAKEATVEALDRKKECTARNILMIAEANTQEKLKKLKDPKTPITIFGANKFLPYIHSEIIQLYTGLLIEPSTFESEVGTVSPLSFGKRVEYEINRIQNGESKLDPSVKQIDMSKLQDPGPDAQIFYGLTPRILLVPRDQGVCGACWAYSAGSAIEAQINKIYRKDEPLYLSYQYFIDCDKKSLACRGGFPSHCYEIVANNQWIVFEKDYIPNKDYLCVEVPEDKRYKVNMTGVASMKSDNSDVFFFPPKVVDQSMNWHGLQTNQPSDVQIKNIKKLLFNYGPLTAHIYVDKLLPFFQDGIYNLTNKENEVLVQPNHAVLIAGFGKSVNGDEYWIVRNSWGQDWGIGGYIQVTTKSPIGGITIPLFEDTPPLVQ